jgi:hypothetical protein
MSVRVTRQELEDMVHDWDHKPLDLMALIDRYADQARSDERAALAAQVSEKIREALVLAWRRYVDLFGEEPHGTSKQLAALFELGVNAVLAAHRRQVRA